jgi:hypothetical protein
LDAAGAAPVGLSDGGLIASGFGVVVAATSGFAVAAGFEASGFVGVGAADSWAGGAVAMAGFDLESSGFAGVGAAGGWAGGAVAMTGFGAAAGLVLSSFGVGAAGG